MANDNIKSPLEQETEVNEIINPFQDNAQDLEPANLVNQAETAKIQDHENAIEEIKRKSKQTFGKEFSTEKAQEELLLRAKAQEQKQEIEQNNQQEKSIEEERIKDQELNKYLALKDEYKERGMIFKENSELEQAIKSKEDDLEVAADLKLDQPIVDENGQEIEATEEEKELVQPEIDEIQKVSNRIKEKNTRIQAEQLAAQDEISKQKELLEKAQNKIASEDKELAAIDPERLWKSKSTWQKVLAGIGMILGGAPAVQIVQNAIAQDIEAQKLDRKNTLARREQAIKRVNQHIDKLSALTNDKFKQEKLKIAKDQLQLEQNQLRNKRLDETNKQLQLQLLGKKLSSSEGMDREEFFGLDKELKKTGIPFKDGKFRFANSPEAAKKVQAKLQETNTALNALGQLKGLKDEFLGGAMPLSEAKSRAATLQQAVKGALRLELFGPGVMTDFESKMADKIIGNPANLFSFTRLELAKLDTLMNKLKYSTRQVLSTSGIKLPPSENDRNIAKYIKAKASSKKWNIQKVLKNKKVYDALKKEAMENLNRNNEWVEEMEF